MAPLPAAAARAALRAPLPFAALVAVVLLSPAVAASGDADETLAFTVQVSPQICFEGSSVRSRVRVPRDARNRSMRVEVESERYFSSSTVQLEGEVSPAVYERRWPDLPAGHYVVQVLIVQATGATHAATAQFTVIDPKAEPRSRR